MLAPPPPPPTPSSSSWDLLNVFYSYDSYYPSYSPSRSSKEVREEEGILELEDEEHEVVKEAYSDHQKFADITSPAKAPTAKDEEIGGLAEELPYKRGPSGVDDEDEAPVVEKNVVADEVLQSDDVATLRKYHGISDVVGEIKTQFDKASDTVHDLLKMLEVETVHLGEEAKEVMIEEKLQVLREPKVKRLKHLDERGAGAHKADSTQVEMRKLSTKVRIAIQVVESISKRINKLRDEELWPQINELIQGY